MEFPDFWVVGADLLHLSCGDHVDESQPRTAFYPAFPPYDNPYREHLLRYGQTLLEHMLPRDHRK